MDDTHRVKLDPNMPAVQFILSQLGPFVDDQHPTQIVADVAMALLIIAQLQEIEYDSLGKLLEAGREQSVMAALAFHFDWETPVTSEDKP